ncbi:MAG: endonuclease/exonuclease/phosphatase family protein [Caulobacter sp.]|nr:endonuclease/exonuclease/phosphatase family protein [Caulobacter sp.]
MRALFKFLSGLARAAALLITAGCALLLLLAQGGRFSDRLDVLTHFTPWLLAGSVLGLALWVFAGRHGRLTPAIAVVGGLSALVLMGPELLAAAGHEKAPAAGPTLKIVQFNLWGRNRDPDATARWILEEDPDVIVLQEGFAKSGGVARALSVRYPHRTTCAEPRACSTMILSKRAPIAESGLQAGVSDANLSGAWATFQGSRGAYTVVGAHYTWPFPAGPQQQQTLRLSRVLDRFPKESLVVVGDFNSTPWSFSLRRQDRLFGLERRTRALFTWPAGRFSSLKIAAPFPVLAIDQVYAGSAWKTVEVRRGPALGSDHYPVVVELARP